MLSRNRRAMGGPFARLARPRASGGRGRVVGAWGVLLAAALAVPVTMALVAPDELALGGSARTAADAPGPGPVDMSLQGCVEVGAGRFVSFDHARRLLPPGFEPADAADFLGMPVPSGRALVLTGHLDCEWSELDGSPVTWADLIVYVETPTVPGLELPRDRDDFYQLVHYTSGASTVAAFEAVGFHAVLADVRPSFLVDPSVPLASASTAVDGDAVLAFDAAAAMLQPYVLKARFWQQTPTGLAYVEHDRTPTHMFSGSLTSCAAAEGSPFAEAFGASDCAGPDAIGGVFPERTDFTSTLRFLPGAAPE